MDVNECYCESWAIWIDKICFKYSAINWYKFKNVLGVDQTISWSRRCVLQPERWHLQIRGNGVFESQSAKKVAFKWHPASLSEKGRHFRLHLLLEKCKIRKWSVIWNRVRWFLDQSEKYPPTMKKKNWLYYLLDNKESNRKVSSFYFISGTN